MSKMKPDEERTGALSLPRLHWAMRHEFEHAEHEPEEPARETLLYFIERGTLRFSISAPIHQEFEAGPGSLVILPTGAMHSQSLEANTSFLAVFFARCRFEFSDAPRMLELAPDDMAISWMLDLARLRLQSSAQRDITDHLLAALLSRLKQLESRHATLRSLHPSVASALQWIDNNLATNTTLDELAARSHCSSSHLRALFKSQVGSGVLRYQQDKRMQHALELLSRPQLSLREVALRCGYGDAEYFARLFRRYHGASPGKVRKRKMEGG